MSATTAPKSIKKLLINETLRVLLIWVLLLLGFGVFQVSLYRSNQLSDLSHKLEDIAQKRSQQLAAYLSLSEEASGAKMILQDIKQQNHLGEVSISQGYFSEWPAVNCRLANESTEVCESFVSGGSEVRHRIHAHGEIWYLYLSKNLNRPWGSHGWWAASVIGFLVTSLVLCILFVRFVFLMRKEVLIPSRELIEVLGFADKEKKWWLKNKASTEMASIASRLFDQQIQLEQKTVLAEVGKISTKVAHDIRSPLSLLNVLVQKEKLDPEEMALAKSAVDRISAISEELLEVKNEKSQSLHWLQSKINEVINEKRHQYQNLNISLNIEDSVVMSRRIKRSTMLMRAIENLITNALQAAPKDIQKFTIKLNLQTEGRFLVLQVLDTGCGLNSAQMQKIAVGETFSTKSQGHGIGLSSISEFISSQEGRFEVFSLENNGSLFQIKYPIS